MQKTADANHNLQFAIFSIVCENGIRCWFVSVIETIIDKKIQFLHWII